MNHDKLMVVGYSNKENVYQRNWEVSMRRAGFQYSIIGRGQEWRGWITRQKAYLKYLEGRPDDDTIYILVDVYDLVANSKESGGPTSYLERFHRVGKPVVVGAEPNCNSISGICRPLSNYWDYNEKRGPYLYYNGGFISGYRRPLIDMIGYMLRDYEEYPRNWNEQVATSVYIDLHPNTIHLDCRADFIGNVICHPFSGNVSHYVTRGNLIYNDYHDTCPFFIHTPSSNIDAMGRYNRYGKIVLQEEWKYPSDGINLPGYHWVIILIILIPIIVLVYLILHMAFRGTSANLVRAMNYTLISFTILITIVTVIAVLYFISFPPDKSY